MNANISYKIIGNKIRLENSGYGIWCVGNDATLTVPNNIINNFISVSTTLQINAYSCIYNFSIKSTNYTNVFDNNMLIYGLTGLNSYVFHEQGYGTTNLFDNNIISQCKNVFEIFDYNNNLKSNYNNFYYKGVFASTFGGFGFADLKHWQDSTLLDSSSLSINPNFISTTDLHATNDTLSGAGLSISGITTDIDGNTRPNPPTIGANEIKKSGCNLIARFKTSADSGCAPFQVTFTDTSTSSGKIKTWFWQFGDGNNGISNTVTNTYQKAGVYTVTLTVKDGLGCVDSFSKKIYVFTQPVDSFKETFNDKSAKFTPADTTLASYFWTFGDGAVDSFSTKPTHVYAAYGSYVASLIAMNSHGCTSIYQSRVYVNPPNTISVTFLANDTYCVNTYIPFKDSLIYNNCSAVKNFWWYWGDKTVSEDSITQIQYHLYQYTGVYKIQLVAYTIDHCLDTFSKVIVISNSCKNLSAFFTANDTNCAYSAMSFADSSKSNSCGTINHWLWDFGDGNSSTVQNPSHTYTVAGKYTVTLTVSSSGGCTDSFSKNVYIDSACVWPGDANANKVVEITDVLNIGIAYNDSGARRAYPSNLWDAKYADNWGRKFITGADFKHADCNGDGVVDSLDLIAIAMNWGDFHFKNGAVSSGNPSDPPFSVQFTKDSFLAGSTAMANLVLGTASNPVKSAYGFAAAYSYDHSYIDSSIKVSFDSSWLGAPGKDFISFVKNDTANGMLYFAVTRINHINISGFGNVGSLSVVLPDNLSGKHSVYDNVKLTPVLIKLISFDEATIPLYSPEDSFVLYQTGSGLQPVNNNYNIRLYPSPASNILYVDAGNLNMENITISDITGTVIYRGAANSNKLKIDISKFSQGVYILSAQLKDGDYIGKFIKTN